MGEIREENTLLKQAFLASPDIISWLLGDYSPPRELASLIEFITPSELEKVEEELLDRAYERSFLEREKPILVFHGSDSLRRKMAVRHLAALLNKPLLWVDLGAGGFSEKIPDVFIFELVFRDVLLNDALVCFSGWDVCLDQDGLVDQTIFEIINNFPLIPDPEWLFFLAGQHQ